MLRIITLMENQPSENKALKNEHGLSLYIEAQGTRLLFDCGPGDGFLYNARKLGVDLRGLDGVALSHNHYDHAAGYRDLIEGGSPCRVLYTGEGFFERKYASADGLKFCDLSSGLEESFLAERGIKRQVCGDSLQVGEGLWLEGNFKRAHAMETIPERFFKRTKRGMERDGFSDEICAAAETERGLILIAGCSHPGILNMVKTVMERHKKPVWAVLGGTHLVEADKERIHATMDELEAMGTRLLAICHCSGDKALETAKSHPGLTLCKLSVGDTMDFD